MIFRHDDVNPSTDFQQLREIHDFLTLTFPDCEIWSCVNILGKQNSIGAVYPDLPLRNKPVSYFYRIDAILEQEKLQQLSVRKQERVASHGLLHAIHSQMNQEEQEFSILTSCSLLSTSIFVPPFNEFNEVTESICTKNNIRLARPSDGWKSLETAPFASSHDLWFFHAWRYKNTQEFIDSITRLQPIAQKGDLWWQKK